MILCFAFRGSLVRVLQAPLKEVDPQVGTLRALGITLPLDAITPEAVVAALEAHR